MKTKLITLFVFCAQLSVAQHKSTGIFINGKVLDYHSGKAVPHIELKIVGTDLIKETDNKGRFKFQLPDTFAGKPVVIDVTQKGKLFLDSTGSVITETMVQIDATSAKNEMIIYRYPLEILPLIYITSYVVKLSDKF